MGHISYNEISCQSGLTILFASSELEELISVADRVVVMNGGDISGQSIRTTLAKKLSELATGRAV